MSNIVFVPLDERPCNRIYPDYVGRISGLKLSIPPKELLGKFKKAGDVEGIWEWILSQAEGASHMILSMDTMLYGGIVPSRLHQLSEETCEKRITRLKQLKELNPRLQLYAFQLITRAPGRDGSGEEPDYYEDFGFRIFRYGLISDKVKLGKATEEEKKELEEIITQVPEEYFRDFCERRRINYRNHIQTIEQVEKGVIDYLIIPLDDCQEYGYAPSERRQLGGELAKRWLLNKVFMYPGADEIGCTLVARAINDLLGVTPKVYLDYSSLRGRMQIPSYEDRSIGETVLYHLLAAGCEEAELSGLADFVLAVNPPTPFSLRLEKELITEEVIVESERNIPAFLSRIQNYEKRGIPVGIADCAIPNEADCALMEFLHQAGMLESLTAFAAWNTSSNTLGTVLAHLCACHGAEIMGKTGQEYKEWSKEFLFYRYLEDWGYMSKVRRPVTDILTTIDPSLNRLDLKDKGEVVKELVMKGLIEFQKQYFPEAYDRYEISFPWNRMFEIEFKSLRSIV